MRPAQLIFLILSLLLYACSPVSQSALRKTLAASEKEFNDHIGFCLYDPVRQKTLAEYQSDRYFTPASNTKIFTLFSSLKILGDSIPAFYYATAGDSLIIWGSGDPGFLYKNTFDNGRTYRFLGTAPQPLFLSTDNFHTEHFGPGWAWDDYSSYYSPERSAFPVYGNIFSVQTGGKALKVTPPYFRSLVSQGNIHEEEEVIREPWSNTAVYHPGPRARKTTTEDVPFRVDALLTARLLSDTLHRPVGLVSRPLPAYRNVFYSVPADSLYKEMMQESDNFIAEQLLLVCASVLSDTLKPEVTITHVKDKYLRDLADQPVWVDGSGLSRYNLFTPRSIVQLWQKIYVMVPRERLFPLLATGGKAGTIKGWYKAGAPYIFGKTGSLSNNHCLSGYLVTKKGKTLIFSFMNSNFTKPGNEVRGNMQSILKMIYDHY